MDDFKLTPKERIVFGTYGVLYRDTNEPFLKRAAQAAVAILVVTSPVYAVAVVEALFG